MQNWQQTLLAQYANAPTLVALIDQLDQCVDPAADLDAFYDTIWNVATANSHGLDIWGRIVNVSRRVQAALPPAEFGFAEAFNAATPTDGVQPFNYGVFNDGSPPVVRTVTLGTEPYRTLIMTKAMANITDCSCASLNRLLAYLFAGRGRCYALDTGRMTMQYVFEFPMSILEVAVLTQSGVLPRPTGVLCNLVEATDDVFGFSNTLDDFQPFNQGVFSSGALNAS
ncbi:DUF2612 domain-containing protein [Burkholderia territorii]|uniref:DUF2612 domain-containing protein n=1 Tax=Burkholderia territorii TaxID=1503055 RepID=UPI00075DBD8A|nr:DUF2612 domain-containing protein [Burkholderia territorii]KWO48987.1 hypothetical protein WT98_19670 [Burkholderia territorii]